VDAPSSELRFEFGKNWTRFLELLDDDRIAAAERSLVEMLNRPDLRSLSFLDVGSGSGLFSLAAKRLGAGRVYSFDYDPASVACTAELKRRYFPSDPTWSVELGSAVDTDYVRSLGVFDIVYSWGVLHHTGDMWRGLGAVAEAVKPQGSLFIAIYNDQGDSSRRWTLIKRLYNRSPRPLRFAIVVAVGGYKAIRGALRRVIALKNPLGVASSERTKRIRGMSVWHDLVDWVGGYPFEVAKPEEVFEFFRDRGFILHRLRTVGGGLGNNEFVFVRGA